MKITRKQLRQLIMEAVHSETPSAETAFDPKSPLGVEILTLRNDISLLEKKVAYLIKRIKDDAVGKT